MTIDALGRDSGGQSRFNWVDCAPRNLAAHSVRGTHKRLHLNAFWTVQKGDVYRWPKVQRGLAKVRGLYQSDRKLSSVLVLQLCLAGIFIGAGIGGMIAVAIAYIRAQ